MRDLKGAKTIKQQLSQLEISISNRFIQVEATVSVTKAQTNLIEKVRKQ